MRYLFIALTLISAVSCSPQRRLARILKNNPTLAKDSIPLTIHERTGGFTYDTFITFPTNDSIVSPTFPVRSVSKTGKGQILSSHNLSNYHVPDVGEKEGTHLGTSPILFHKGNITGSITPTDSGLRLRITETPQKHDTTIYSKQFKVEEHTGASWWWMYIVIAIIALILTYVIIKALK